MPPSDLNATTAILELMEPGQHAWYWFCPRASPGLLVQPMRADPLMKDLKRDIAQIKKPWGATAYRGLLTADADGRLLFGGPTASIQMLISLADWTAEHVGAHPALARIRGAKVREVRRAVPPGPIQELGEAAWRRVPEAPAPGSIAEASSTLFRLKAGERAWFATSDDGAKLIVVRQDDDPEGARFARRRRALDATSPLTGLIRRQPRGRLSLSVETPLPDIQERIRRITTQHGNQHPSLLQLWAGDVRTAGGKAQPILPDREEIEQTAATLADLQIDQKAYFWFTIADQHEVPMLLIDLDRAALKQAAKGCQGEGAYCRGTLQITQRGWPIFSLRRNFPGLLSMLAAWTSSHSHRHTSLTRLWRSRMVITSPDGLQRRRRDDVWNLLMPQEG